MFQKSMLTKKYRYVDITDDLSFFISLFIKIQINQSKYNKSIYLPNRPCLQKSTTNKDGRMSWENERYLYFIVHCNVSKTNGKNMNLYFEWLTYSLNRKEKIVDITTDFTSNTSLFIAMFQKQMVKIWICILNDELTF